MVGWEHPSRLVPSMGSPSSIGLIRLATVCVNACTMPPAVPEGVSRKLLHTRKAQRHPAAAAVASKPSIRRTVAVP